MILPIFKKYLKLLISIVLVSAMGCGIMIGLSGAYVSLETSLNEYVSDYRYPDAVVTTDVVNRSRAQRLTTKVDSVSEVTARLCADTVVKSKTGRLLSVRFFTFEEDDRQKFHFWSRKPDDSKDEIYLEVNFAEDNDIAVGDTVSFKFDDTFRTCYVAAIVSMPETLSMQPTEDSWGENPDFGFAYVPRRFLEKMSDEKLQKEQQRLDDEQAELLKNWEDAKSRYAAAAAAVEQAQSEADACEEAYYNDYSEESEQAWEQAKSLLEEKQTALAAEKEKLAAASKEAADRQDELNDEYNTLEHTDGYDVLCNQFQLYFKEGTDPDKALAQAENVLGAIVKSSYTAENSAVRNRININLEPIETMSYYMPAIFFTVILIVVFLFMSLIVKQSRRDIGILRALGFSKASIRLLFCSVNLVVSLAAVVLGSVVGVGLMYFVGSYYQAFFPLPDFTYGISGEMVVLSVVLTLVVGQISTLISTSSIARIHPSEAMSRPAPMTAEIPQLVQKLTAHASPMMKFSITSMLRNKMRFVFSVVCVAASVMMIFSSLAFITSKNYILHQMYEERIHYDCQIFFKNEPDDAFIEQLNTLGYVKDATKLPYFQSEISFGKQKEKAVINGLAADSKLVGVYGEKSRQLTIPQDGMILEKHLAQTLGVSAGDTVSVDGVDIQVTDISDQCISRFQYISPATAEKLGDVTFGSVICNISEKDEKKLLEFLSESSDYLYIVFTRMSLMGNEKIFRTYDLAAWIIIVFAIIIGLVIVINTAQTNLLEKKKQLCILRTLGFQHRDISRNWFIQSFLQFICSCVIGLPTGIYVAQVGLQMLSTEGREYVFANSLPEYLFTILLVFGYIVVSHLIAMQSMKRWDMVESVKDKE